MRADFSRLQQQNRNELELSKSIDPIGASYKLLTVYIFVYSRASQTNALYGNKLTSTTPPSN